MKKLLVSILAAIALSSTASAVILKPTEMAYGIGDPLDSSIEYFQDLKNQYKADKNVDRLKQAHFDLAMNVRDLIVAIDAMDRRMPNLGLLKDTRQFLENAYGINKDIPILDLPDVLETFNIYQLGSISGELIHRIEITFTLPEELNK